MPTCIYCRSASAEPFPAEHVIPKCFGLFRNGITLHCVCGNCNRFFGDHLELHFDRETGESVVRFQYGLRDNVAASPRSRLTATVKVPGPIFGAKVTKARRRGPLATSTVLPAAALTVHAYFIVALEPLHQSLELVCRVITPETCASLNELACCKLIGQF